MDNLIADKIEKFFTKFKKLEFHKGEMLIKVDEIPKHVFYLYSGCVKKYAISKKGDEVVVNIFKPISFFPMSHVVNNSQNAFYYEAVTNVTLWRAPKEEVLLFIKNNPDVVFDLLKRVYRGTDGMETRMTFLMAGNAYDRLINEILIYIKRFGEFLTDKSEIDSNKEQAITLHITEKDLAASSGMTRETVSREMRILKEKGLITFLKNQLFVPSISKLENELTS